MKRSTLKINDEIEKGGSVYKSILVPVDGSEQSMKALNIAAELVNSAGTIYLLHVPEMPLATDPLGMAVGAPGLEMSTEAVTRAGQQLLKHMKAAEEAGHGVLERMRENLGVARYELKPMVVAGTPAKTIIEQSGDLGVDAVVMGSRGMTDMKSLVLGSTSHKVMHTAECTVIIVH
ncbi:MAG: universal stress protein [Gammaproteobacteria bacterium]